MKISRRNLLLGSAAATAAPGLAGLLASDAGIELPKRRSGGSSLWQKIGDGVPALPSLQQSQTADICIVGGGYTGLCAAIYLKKIQPSLRVLVLESHQLGAGASTRNSGAVYAKFTSIDDQDFAEQGLQHFKNFLRDESINCDFQPANTLYLYEDNSEYKTAQNNQKSTEQWIVGDKLKQGIASDFYAAAKVGRGFYKLNPAKLLSEYRRIALEYGVEVYENTPVLGVNDKGSSLDVQTSIARVSCAKVLLATNAYTPRLGYVASKVYPVHQYSCASDKLSPAQIRQFALDKWDLRFEPNILPITFGLSTTGHFFLRVVLGYASDNSTEWKDVSYARELVHKYFYQRYPQLRDVGLPNEWHGVTAHTISTQSIASLVDYEQGGKIYFCGAYNGLGIMPSHFSAYLTARKIVGIEDPAWHSLSRLSQQLSFPPDYYRSLMLKGSFNLLNSL
ncbi:FAD-binding oxidoreductase [uncultured Pseudoteredinibacter sp.]|uniref:NAD(P)/FAD-dependent oxidoreductase n=1 Tax=uncultured Pseudoteredinibacter sp. TaxID=1641701 RepID=UPI002610A5B4|nr:FAD-binding oxidoreductase [uncultured Pseudoteredinibacter sp.]